MKKTLAILLSCILVVGVVFAIAISASADEKTQPLGTTVQVTMADGTTKFLGYQPTEGTTHPETGKTVVPGKEDPENGIKVTTYTETAVNTLNGTTGTLTLDPATGTLTLDGVTGVANIICYTGSLTVVVKGENTIEATSGNNVSVNIAGTETAEAGDLTIKGDGTLTTKTNNFGIVCQHGRLTITDNVTVKATTTDASGAANPDAIHVASTGKGLTIDGNAKVWATAPAQAIRVAATAEPSYLGGNAEIHALATADVATINSMSSKKYTTATFKEVYFQDNVKFYAEGFAAGVGQKNDGVVMTVKDNALLDIDVKDCVSWKAGIDAKKYTQLGGTVDIDVVMLTKAAKDTDQLAPCGLASSNGEGMDLLDGKLDISVTAGEQVLLARATGIFTVPVTDGSTAVNIAGTDITLKVSVLGGCGTSSSGGFDIQTKGTFNMTGGSITADIGEGVTGGLFHSRIKNNVFNISGGKISGTGDVFVHATQNSSVKIIGGEIDWNSRVQNLRPSKSTITIAAADGSYPVDGAAKTLKITPLAAPVLKTEGVTKDDVPVKWDAVADAVGYNVYVNGELKETVTATSYTIPAMPNTKYDIKVESVNALGGKGLASTVSVTTPDGISSRVPPAAPTGLKLVGADAASAVVAWNAVDKAEGYFVYVDGVQVNEEAITAPVYKLTALEAGKEVTVLVKASSIAGKSEESASIKVAPVASDKVTLVEVVLADGTSAYLGSGNTTVNGATGTVAFDAATGTVTVTDVTGVDSILGAKKMTVVFKGASEIGANAEKNVLTAEELIIEGDGSVKIEAAKATYPIFAGKSLVVQGSVKLTMKAPAGSALLHAGRVGGDCSVIVRGNAVLDVSGTGRGLYAAGEKTTVIVTENANVTLETSNDTIAAVCDTDDEGYTGAAGGFVEFSGNAKVLVKNGNCGIRVNFNIKGEHDATVSLICKDNAYVDITAPGQTAYLVDGASANSKGKVVSVFTVQDNAFLKLTNNGPASNGNLYPALQLKTDGNTVTIDGGTLELVGHPDKACYAVGGKTTYKFDGYKTFVGGVDKASAKDVTKFSTTDKYIMITFGNPPTADVNYVWVAVLVGFSVLTAAGVVIARKKAII